MAAITGRPVAATAVQGERIGIFAAGNSNKEIGAQLGLTEKTVKHHMTNILQKLQVRNRVEAALLARASERPER